METTLPLESHALRALIEVSKTVTSTLELHEVLALVIHAADTTVGVEASSLLLMDEESGNLVFEVTEGEKAEAVRRVVVPLGEGIAGWSAEQRKSAIINDVSSDPRFAAWVDDITGFQTRAILCVPVVYKDRLLGVMELINRIDCAPFDTHDQILCESIASLAAIAIDNAQIHAEKVQAARLAAVGQTMASLAHGIKNILNGVRGGSYILDLGLRRGHERRIQQGWDMVKRNNGFLEDLVLDMLSYSKDRVPVYAQADLNEICLSVIESVTGAATGRRVDVRWEPCPEAASVVVDSGGIRRAVLNLVSNAVDACRDDGSGVVSVGTSCRDAELVCVHVSDNGCGISAEHMARLFREFFSTKGSHGTGLGLAVSQKIVTEHGGRIEVDSVEGKGTDFTIVLPARPPGA